MALTDHRRGALGALAAAFLVSAALIAGVFLTPAGGPIHGQQGPGQQQQASGLVCSAFGGGPPYNFGTYEATRDRAPYLTAQRLAERSADEFDTAMVAVKTAAAGDDNLMPHLIVAARAGATIGELSDLLREAFGEYREPALW